MLARTRVLAARFTPRATGRAPYATSAGGTAQEQNQRNLLMLGGGAVAAVGAWYYMKASPAARKEYDHIKEGVQKNPGPTK
ncbi:hypothetical protein JCM8202_005723 [Rhodotorula sphaerocarpa]